MRGFIVAWLIGLTPTVGFAEGCSLEGGTTLVKVEAMNQMMLDRKVDRFSAMIKAELGGDVANQMGRLAEMYKDGFHGCATIAQRVDIGGMVQNVVFFNGKSAPLFIYWMAVAESDREVLLSFKFSTNLDEVMSALR